MSDSQAVWAKLVAIDVNKHTDTKGKFKYLSWTWAWATLQENYPESTYEFRDILWMPNGSCEVWVDLTVEGISRSMWLAVTDFNNKPVLNPSSDLIANARMRCLVKAIAMFGLGHYIYAGESLPMEVEQPANDKQAELYQAIIDNSESIKFIKDSIATKDYEGAYEAWSEISDEDKAKLWVAPTKFDRAAFTTEERAVFKSNEWNAARHTHHGTTPEPS
jgi:hypothetical protein